MVLEAHGGHTEHLERFVNKLEQVNEVINASKEVSYQKDKMPQLNEDMKDTDHQHNNNSRRSYNQARVGAGKSAHAVDGIHN